MNPSERQPTMAGAPNQMFGRYNIVRELGRGGMGVVYLAHDPQLQRHVALKIIKHTIDQDKARERFIREASVLARLDHPHIVKVFDVGEEHGYSFFTMEFIDGHGLDNLLRQNLSLSQAITLIIQVAHAVHYAHEQGVLHRDLKPSNILVTRDMQPKVMDFGLAKEIGDRRSRVSKSQDIVGTPEYMSPEQVVGKSRKLDARSDVYSLGVVLYEAMVGHTPFGAANTMALLYRIGFEEAQPPSHFVPRISRDLEAICLKTLEKDRDKRYQTALEMATDLERYQRHEPVLAKPATPAVRAWKWMVRHQLVCSLLAMTVVLVAGFIAYLLYQNNKEKALRIAAQQGRDAAERAERAARLAERRSAYDAIQSRLVLAKPVIEERDWLAVAAIQQEVESELKKQEAQDEVIQRHHALLEQAAADIRDFVLAHYPRQIRRIHWREVAAFADPSTHAYYNLQPWPAQKESQDNNGMFVPSQPAWRFHMARHDDGITYLYDIEQGKLTPLPDGFKPSTHGVAFSQQGDLVGLGNNRGDVAVWRAGSDKIDIFGCMAELSGDDHDEIQRVRLSADNKWLVSATNGHYAVWNVAQKSRVYHRSYMGANPCIAFSKDGKWLALGTAIQAMVLELAPLGNDSVAKIKVDATPVSLVFGPRDRTLIIGEKNDIRIVPLPSGGEASKDRQGQEATIALHDAHAGEIFDLALSDDETCLASVAADSRLQVWSTYGYRKMFSTHVSDHVMGACFVAFHPHNGQIELWNARYVDIYNLRMPCRAQTNILQRPDFKVGGLLKSIQSLSFARTRSEESCSISCSPNAQYLAFSFLGRICVWDVVNDKITELPPLPIIQRMQVAFHSDTLLLGNFWGPSQLYGWHPATGERLLTQANFDNGLCRAGLPFLLSDYRDKGQRVTVWEVRDRHVAAVQELLTGDERIYAKTVSPDGKLLAFTSQKNKHSYVTVWQLGDEPKAIATSKSLTQADSAICFAGPDRLLLGNSNGEVWITDWHHWQGGDTNSELVSTFRLPDPVKRMWYDERRRLYWILTPQALFIYPHLAQGAWQNDKVRDVVRNIYPLPVYSGYPLLVLDFNADFSEVALALQWGEIRLVPIGGARK